MRSPAFPFWFYVVAFLGTAALTPAAEIEKSDVFVSGDDGFFAYRIPAVLRAPDNSILAMCEGRKNSRSDHGDIDLVLKRSTDEGKTWSKLQTIYEKGGTAKVTIGNPCPVVDESTQTVWLPFCEDNNTVWMTHSKDNGKTWSSPVEITSSVKKPGWGWYATGPGVGIQLKQGVKKGRLLIPCDHREKKNGKWIKMSHCFFSDDHGKTWELGDSVDDHTDECQVAELQDGRVIINMRNYWAREGGHPERGGMRAVAISDDGGSSWNETSFDETLIEPICQAGLVSFEQNESTHLLFTNPASKKRRHQLTARLSKDGGKTWHASKLLHSGPSAYSNPIELSGGMLGCLYEGGEKNSYDKIIFARFSFE